LRTQDGKKISEELEQAGKKWRTVRYKVKSHDENGEELISEVIYPCKITTTKGQEVLGVIRLNDTYSGTGTVEIPFGWWRANEGEREYCDLVMKKVKALGVDEFIGGINNTVVIEQTLGIGDTKMFRSIFSGGDLASIMCTQVDEDPVKKDKQEGQTAGAKVEALARDFISSYPGVKIEPMSLTE